MGWLCLALWLRMSSIDSNTAKTMEQITELQRRMDALDYLPEPDIFHDIAGHVPMHTDKNFAETLVRFVLRGERGNWSVTLGDLAVRPLETPAV